MTVIRKTKAVKIVIHLFELKKSALSVVELIDELQHQMNKTTVYRILNRLEKDGLLHSFIGKDGLKHYAKCNGCPSNRHFDAHPHFQCNLCGKIDCWDLAINTPVIKNYIIESVELFLTGKCSDCLAEY
jgi:Fur family ferric uptake transcriptional regulator